MLLSVKVRTPGFVFRNDLAYLNAIERCLMVDERQPWKLARVFPHTFFLFIYLFIYL